MISENEYIQALVDMDMLSDAVPGSPEFEEMLRLSDIVDQYMLEHPNEV